MITALRARGDRARDRRRVEATIVADVGEHRRRADAQHRIRGGDEGQRRGDHLVARSDAEREDGEVERDAAVGNSNGVRDLATRGERVLEVRDGRPAGQRSGAQGIDDRRDVALLELVASVGERPLADRRAAGDGRRAV